LFFVQSSLKFWNSYLLGCIVDFLILSDPINPQSRLSQIPCFRISCEPDCQLEEMSAVHTLITKTVHRSRSATEVYVSFLAYGFSILYRILFQCDKNEFTFPTSYKEYEPWANWNHISRLFQRCYWFLREFIFFSFFETESHYVGEAGLKLTMYPRLASNLWFSNLCLLSAEITGLNHHPW
jgi:hypothetical protein